MRTILKSMFGPTLFAPLQKAADEFVHATNGENIHKILRSGSIKPLDKITGKVNVEPELTNRGRATMDAAEAKERMAGVKNTDRVFLSRGGVVPSYGDYVIVKDLSHPKEHDRLNLVPNEYTTKRSLSVRHNAKVFVPDEEAEALAKKYTDVDIQPKSKLHLPNLGIGDAILTLGRKLTFMAGLATPQRAEQAKAAGLVKSVALGALAGAGGFILGRETAPVTVLQAAQPAINPRTLLGPRAMHVGSTALGTSIDDSDVDILIPYKTEKGWRSAIDRLRAKYPELQVGEYSKDKPNKRVLTGPINGQRVDVVLAHGEQPMAFAKRFKELQASITPEEQAAIRANKARLKNSIIAPETRYKLYKKQLASDMGLTPLYF